MINLLTVIIDFRFLSISALPGPGIWGTRN